MECAHGLTPPTCGVCKYGPASDEGYNGPPPDVDYAWQARSHDTVTRRTNKGGTSQRVTRFGAACVQGALDVDVNGRPLLAEYGPDVNIIHPSTAAARLLVAACDRAEIRRGRHGLSVIDIQRITDAAYGDLLPKLENGTEVRQYAQVIHRDRTASAATTQHTCGIDGGRTTELGTLWVADSPDAVGVHTARVHRDDTIGSIVEQTDAYGAQTLAAWPTRGTADSYKFGRIPHAPRESDPKHSRVFRVAPDGTCERVALPVVGAADVVGLPTTIATPVPPTAPRLDYTIHRGVALPGLSFGTRGGMRRFYWTTGVASVTHHNGRDVLDIEYVPSVVRSVERLFVGHTAVDRAPAIVRTTDAREQRTTEHADARPTTSDAWCALIERLAPGGRGVAGDVSFTCTPRGDYWCATVPNVPRIRVRTARALADRLASL